MQANAELENSFELCGQLDALVAVLSEEYEAIRSSNVEQLERIVAKKNALLESIEPLAKRFELAMAGLQDNDAAENHPELDSIREKLFKCEQQNTINGASIHTNRRLTSSLLNILTIQETNQQGSYDDSGKISQFAQSPATVTIKA
ncbi:MAG: flagellar protein FlgN [Pseudomonadota bacterium]